MELTIVEKFLLLVQHSEKGRFNTSVLHINYGIVGAILLEMYFEDRFVLENEKLIINGFKKSQNKIIEDISSLVRNNSKPRKLKYWFVKLGRKSRKYKSFFWTKMSDKNLIRIEKKKFLGLVPYQRVYLIDQRKRNKLIIELKKNLLSGKINNDEDIAILGLIEACNLSKIFSNESDMLKRIKKALKENIKENQISNTLGKVIKQLQIAVVVASS